MSNAIQWSNKKYLWVPLLSLAKHTIIYTLLAWLINLIVLYFNFNKSNFLIVVC